MMINNIDDIQANTELKCVLRYFPTSYIDKLPKKLLDVIYSNCDDNYNINIDVKQDLKKQHLSKKTKNLLVVLNYNYWVDELEKIEIEKKLNENESKYQKVLANKYNPENLFKKEIDNSQTIEEKVTQKYALEKYNESLLKKIWNKILSILKNVH